MITIYNKNTKSVEIGTKSYKVKQNTKGYYIKYKNRNHYLKKLPKRNGKITLVHPDIAKNKRIVSNVRAPRRKRTPSRTPRRKRRSEGLKGFTKAKCKELLKEKIKINMEEWKSGKFVSQKQALAVSYSQIKKKYPGCRRFFKK